MSIAFDAASNGAVGSSADLTFSHTCTGSNLILIVTVTQQGNDVTPTCTYNGVSMTLLTERTYTNGRHGMFYLLSPATGANNIVIHAGSDTKAAAGASYTGAKQSSQPDAQTGAANSSAATGFTASNTSVADNCWTILGAGVQGNGVASTALTASTGATQRAVNNSVNQGAGIYDSNSAKTPAGSVSEAVTFASGRYGYTIISISPLVALTRTLSDSVMNGASRSATVSKVMAASRSLADSMMYAVGRGVFVLLNSVVNLFSLRPSISIRPLITPKMI